MRSAIITAGWLAFTSALALAQIGEPEPEFEVASVRPSAPGENGRPPRMSVRGGPGTTDPGQFACTGMPLSSLVLRAYGLRVYQFSGPTWLGAKSYDIVAKVPSDASKDQFNRMLQNLLIERFRLKFHHELREVSAHQLVIAKGGSKLRETSSPPRSQPGPSALPSRNLDKDGFVELTPDGPDVLGNFRAGRQQEAARRTSMASLAELLEAFTGNPVVDRTGLTGLYDFKLAFSLEGLDGAVARALATSAAAQEEPTGGLTLFDALQQELGLKLEAIKAQIDVMVVDSADMVPDEN